MRNQIARIAAIMVVFAACASAHAAMARIYFSTTGLANGVLNAPPPEAATHVNPSVALGTQVYLYVELLDAGTWNQIALNYTGADGVVNLSPGSPGPPLLQRWNSNSDYFGRLNGTDPTNLFVSSEQGLPNPYPLGQFDPLEAAGGSVPGAETFYLGFSSTTAPGSVFLHVGDQGISRVGGDPNTDGVFFGWGDAAVHGNEFGRASDIEDLTITPEPASGMLLLAITLLGVRRR